MNTLQIAQLAQRLGLPEWEVEMALADQANGISANVQQDVGRGRSIHEPSSIIPRKPDEMPVVRGTGWQDEKPLGPVIEPGSVAERVMNEMIDNACGRFGPNPDPRQLRELLWKLIAKLEAEEEAKG